MTKYFILFFSAFCHFSFGQVIDMKNVSIDITIPEVSLVTLTTTEPLVFYLEPIESAGEKIKIVASATDDLWINYSASLSPNSPFKNIAAQIVSGKVPAGTQLLLEASDYSGGGSGQLGSSEGAIELQNTTQVLLSNIGGSFTGKGPSNGHSLLYTLNITNYSLLDHEDTTTLTIMYTLTDN